MLTREAFEGEIRRFEKQIENELTDESIETLWRFFSMQTIKFMKETLMQCTEIIEASPMTFKNGATIPPSKPKDIQAMNKIMHTMLDSMAEQNDNWLKVCQKTNRMWTVNYFILFALHLWSTL